MTDTHAPRPLRDGLVLRTATPADLDQIGALLIERGDPVDGLDHRLVVEDPDLGWDACAVVVDGDRVVSTATLLDETLRVHDVVLPAGQVELVATDAAYEGRGLVRELMGWAHERSAARGHLLQVMIGIPYFYRLFGYEYAIDLPRDRRVVDVPAATAAGSGPATSLRDAVEADLPALAALQDAAQSTADVVMPHPAARWRALLAQDASTTVVLVRDGVVVASARLRDDDDAVLLAEPAALDRDAADALLRAVAERAGDNAVVAVHRPGTVTGLAWDARLEPPSAARRHQYYVRLPDPAGVVDALRPVLARRARAAGVDELLITTYRRAYRFTAGTADDDAPGPLAVDSTTPYPDRPGGVAVPPELLAALLLGQGGIARLAAEHADVLPGPAADVAAQVFGPQTADLLTYYLPF